jgi:hypothetical protein
MADVTPRDSLRFTPDMLARPRVSGIDAVSGLQHFAIVTWAVSPERVRPHIHERFELDCITAEDGEPRALISMVPFLDKDFHFARMPRPKFEFGQTNYRAYVIDRETGERLVWFFGTTLDSWTVNIPHYAWRLPWHRAHTLFDCRYDHAARRYDRYVVESQSDWGPAHLELADDGTPVTSLAGFASLEAGLVTLTHPLRGAFYRRDGRLGSYSVWHERLELTTGRVLSARVGLYERMGLLTPAEAEQPHSVLIQPLTEFTIYLPPRRL